MIPNITAGFCIPCRLTKYDELVESRKSTAKVIPAKAGIQINVLQNRWTPVFTGVTTFYEAVKYESV
jgi:hypothetical protein